MKTITRSALLLRPGARPWMAAGALACVGLSTSAQPESDPTNSGSITRDNSLPAGSASRPNQSAGMANAAGAAAESVQTEANPTTKATSPSLQPADRRFLLETAENNRREIALARLASQRANAPEVRSYAQQLVSEHQQLAAELAKVAAHEGVTLSQAMPGEPADAFADPGRAMSGDGIDASPRGATSAEVRNPGVTGDTATSTAATSSKRVQASAAQDAKFDRNYRALADKAGRAFDRHFVALMATDRRTDVQDFKRVAKGSGDGEIRRFASSQLSGLEAQLQRAKALRRSVAE